MTGIVFGSQGRDRLRLTPSELWRFTYHFWGVDRQSSGGACLARATRYDLDTTSGSERDGCWLEERAGVAGADRLECAGVEVEVAKTVRGRLDRHVRVVAPEQDPVAGEERRRRGKRGRAGRSDRVDVEPPRELLERVRH